MPADSPTSKLRYIVVEGPIGVGKTSLATRLAESFDSELILEQPLNNPFLERFYREPGSSALPTQLYFLFQRAKLIEQMRQADMFQPVGVSDFLLEKDRLFAELTLDQEELKLYGQIYAKLSLAAPKPDLVIYLQAPADVLLHRVYKRGIDYEQWIERRYLERLAEAYARFFHEYDDSPLLIVNAAEIDVANNERDYQQLFEEINTIQRGRYFFNPASHTIL